MTSRILVLGASGGCGRHVVEQGLARGHAVTALVRPGAAYAPPPGARLVRDEVTRAGALAAALPGHDVVISCVGVKRRSATNPWSALTSPPDLVAQVARGLVAAARDAGVTRVLQISAAGVGDSAAAMSAPIRLLITRSQIGVAYRDLAAAEAILAGSGLAWTAVRPVTLIGGPARPTREVTRYTLTARISRASVAAWLLDHVADAPGAPRTPIIAAA